jgi:hypothetical protein
LRTEGDEGGGVEPRAPLPLPAARSALGFAGGKDVVRAGGADCGAGTAGESSPALVVPAGSISQSEAPTTTTSPSSASSLVTMPASGDGTSLSALSVRISTTGSSRETRCPTRTSHLPMVPSTTLSPSWGIRIVVLGMVSLGNLTESDPAAGPYL